METDKTSFSHMFIGVFLQAAIAFGAPPVARITPDCLVVAALCVICLFYGREHSQEERKAADRLHCNHANLWFKYPKEAIKVLWPGNWSAGNRSDFLLPVGVTVGIAVLAHLV